MNTPIFFGKFRYFDSRKTAVVGCYNIFSGEVIYGERPGFILDDIPKILSFQAPEISSVSSNPSILQLKTDFMSMPAMLPPPLFIGDHPLMQKIYAMVHRVATTDATVLITGESGTGKELVARSVHNLGARVTHPFVAINCAALPEELLESELFGHVRGAFTGALSSRVGMFQLADGGTIFLDEIGEMPVSLQAKLLRVLQSKEVRPVGADRVTAINVRVIAATNKDLIREVEKGTFREDLFYRLQVIPVHLPPLRARRSDIPLLVRCFLEKNSHKYANTLQISDEAMVYLWEYDWPGNVRELENLVERMVILSETGRLVPEDLPPHVRSFISEKKLPHPDFNDGEVNLREVLEQFEGRLIDEALRRTNGNKTAAAQMLGLKRTTLVAKLRRKRNGTTALLPAVDDSRIALAP